ncbi:RNA polymerase sigma-70 factor (family 1) [Parabacteroides sp. PF5-5]|uniref:RNA polymerase sigma-70 factor n=1 Tax=unclassified Parabacteroides TaxID=2649774 RepID=UPI00247300E3|nr:MULTISPECIES: RNA polymerase sigma-70 factor [unclassified Parabacteroides]MDH6304094.1 RNA polymerase sigma-70 factor (family 1) [Parabacteroides sp. PH5-39]MDH6315206.1 RNA polymerase sigma-70 factor (family 1) [Parabacteroides sp. PF5-13]MDH6318851.1 RNA polymerase sigma-70 factor (family 1) [Parabacteroides sp. PH5-13]MDH6322580.1 RNA polymerase sigma-70 factor (family 1) [Parabacteroides sp. PH5-8]MDH6326268.1 RNA polymerase sigma-70 factor (family 1) [Parabacteroides sp. PH5-41]
MVLKGDTILYTGDKQIRFDEIYVNNFYRLHRFAKEYVLFDEDAENIVQDVFMTLWEKRDILDVQLSITTYLFSLVKNKCIDHIRRKAVAEEYKQELNLKLKSLEDINHAFASQEDIERFITDAISKLPDRCREIFIKSRFEGKKYREIADEMNLSVNTVENQMSIALKKLRVELKDFLPILLFFIIS